MNPGKEKAREEAAIALYDHWRRNNHKVKGWVTATPSLQTLFRTTVDIVAEVLLDEEG